MQGIIKTRDKDPLGAMVLDYHRGILDARVDVDSPTLEMPSMSGAVMFRSFPEMDTMEQEALLLCKGKVLDLGAGTGCHSLYLQGQGKEVHSLEISPGCIELMHERKVNTPIHCNYFLHENETYDTILILMNGLGFCGSLDGLNFFLHTLGEYLNRGGQVLADSTDLSMLYEEDGEEYLSSDIYYGEAEFVMKYGTISSDPFKWLYVDFHTLEALVEFNGLRCQRLVDDDSGRYLARIFQG